MTKDYLTYGLKSSSQEVITFIEHIIQTNESAEHKGKRKTPVCIWGRHGIGKTELVGQIAESLGYQWRYIAPAQFEEMGDLLGMPKVEGDKTVFVPPSWVPTEDGPGILLIDDVNRADDRILRGIMQLLQNFELVSWQLPPKWQIILTANPDGGDYSVTPMDDAMLTRMMHTTMSFDAKVWAKWAEQAKVDPRGINFVLTYPEMASGELTTPRSLVQFFNSISTIKNLEKELPLVQALAASCLDEETVTAFITFVQQNLAELIEPEKLINAKNFDKEVKEAVENLVKKDILRVDILATLATRVSNFLVINKIKPDKHQLENIQSFIKMEIIPNDIRLTLLQDIINTDNNKLKEVMSDPEVNMMFLKNL